VKASKILTTAMKDITTDRAKSYGPMHTNMRNIATLWSAYLDVPIEAAQVPVMMALLKIGRTNNGSKSFGISISMKLILFMWRTMNDRISSN